MKFTFLLFAAVLGVASAQERMQLPPPPPLRNPMLLSPEKELPLPPGLNGQTQTRGGEAAGWILRRNESKDWQVLWQGRWVGKNQKMGHETIVRIDEYVIEVKGPNGKRNIPLVGAILGQQQKENK